MKSDLRLVVDSNVVVSAVLLPGSTPRKALDKALDDGQLLISEATVTELNEILRRSRFDKYVSEEDRMAFLDAFVRDAELVEVNQVVTDCRDPRDNKFLEVAVPGNAACILSGDSDLLVLNPFRGIVVLTPQEFLAQ